MKKLVYYISEYGYGHASRSIAIIRELLSQDSDIHIQVVHHYALDFLKKSLPHRNVTFYNMATDIGFFLKEGSFMPNLDVQIKEVEFYLNELPKHIDLEVNRLRPQNVDLIISDISPLAFEVAAQLKVPSVGISNFTWYTAFLDLVPLDILSPLEDSYKKMDYFFELAGSKEKNWDRKGTLKLDFHSRDVDFDEVDHIRAKIGMDRTLIFLGLGMKMDLNDINRLPIWNSSNIHFIVSSNLIIDHPNVSQIPFDYIETQNYIAACDLVITKAGWGTVGEAVIAGRPLLIIERDGMREDENTINYLKNSNLAKTISWEGFSELLIDDAYLSKFTNYRVNKKLNSTKEIVSILSRILQ